MSGLFLRLVTTHVWVLHPLGTAEHGLLCVDSQGRPAYIVGDTLDPDVQIMCDLQPDVG